jgi:hypothetical protein
MFKRAQAQVNVQMESFALLEIVTIAQQGWNYLPQV